MAHNVPGTLPFRCGDQLNRRVHMRQIVLRMCDLRLVGQFTPGLRCPIGGIITSPTPSMLLSKKFVTEPNSVACESVLPIAIVYFLFMDGRVIRNRKASSVAIGPMTERRSAAATPPKAELETVMWRVHIARMELLRHATIRTAPFQRAV